MNVWWLTGRGASPGLAGWEGRPGAEAGSATGGAPPNLAGISCHLPVTVAHLGTASVKAALPRGRGRVPIHPDPCQNRGSVKLRLVTTAGDFGLSTVIPPFYAAPAFSA